MGRSAATLAGRLDRDPDIASLPRGAEARLAGARGRLDEPNEVETVV